MARVISTTLALGIATFLSVSPARAEGLQDLDIAMLPFFLLGLCVTLMIFRVQTALARREKKQGRSTPIRKEPIAQEKG